jgi:hypothetical protein
LIPLLPGEERSSEPEHRRARLSPLDIALRRGPGIGGPGPPRETLNPPFGRVCATTPSDPFHPSGVSHLVRRIPFLPLLGTTARVWLLAVACLQARARAGERESRRDSFDRAGLRSDIFGLEGMARFCRGSGSETATLSQLGSFVAFSWVYRASLGSFARFRPPSNGSLGSFARFRPPQDGSLGSFARFRTLSDGSLGSFARLAIEVTRLNDCHFGRIGFVSSIRHAPIGP